MLWRLTNPNFPGCVDAPADHHPGGLEQRPELLVGRARTRRRSLVVNRDGTRADLDQGVHCDRPTVGDDQGVEVGRHDRRIGHRRVGQTQEHGDEGLTIYRRLTPERTEDGLAVELVDHLPGIHRADRNRSQTHIGDRLGEDPSDAQHDGHPELRVLGETGDQFPVALHHRRHEQPHRTVLGSGRVQELGAGTTHCLGIGQAQSHQAPLGLVGDRVATELHHDREPEPVGRGHRALHVWARPLRRDRYALGRQAGLGFRLGEGDGGSGRRLGHGCLPYSAMEPAQVPIRGVIEGFYGTPWTWDERIEVARFCADRGMTHYVYAPKDDPKHRARWRDLYGPLKLVGFDRLIAEGGLEVGFAISPGLDIDMTDSTDRKALRVKIDQVVDLGVKVVMLALDDIPFDPTAGAAHASLTSELVDHLAGRATVVLVPTEYVGMEQTPYLEALAVGVPAEVSIAWTGPAVVNDAITADEARRRAEALGGRPPLLWDNFPVNDALMADRLFLGPLWGREADLLTECSGYLANAMVQPRCSQLPLASIAGWLRGEDPLSAWAAEAGALRVFAEACDGGVPQALARAVVDSIHDPGWPDAVGELASWLGEAARCEASGLAGEADAWLAQVRREARLGLCALRVIQSARPHVSVDHIGRGTAHPSDPDGAAAEALAMAARWPGIRRSAHTVMGPRCSFRPVLGQRSDGAWRMDSSAVEEGRNAIDSVVRLALHELDVLPHSAPPLVLEAAGQPIEVAADGTFTTDTPTTIRSTAGSVVTDQTVPCGPPVPPDREGT